ncbi:MAG: hypothetical protein ACREVK_05425 [Gammaproteobacteria bacterium]
MSATLQQGLAALLVRRTAEGRAKALHGIEAWQKATEAVRQAEKMAEHKINLPNDQVQGVQQAAAQVRRANYVQAVYLEKKATTARNAIITTAIGVFQEQSSNQEGKWTLAQHALQTERDRAISAAKEEKDAKILRIYEETMGSVREFQLNDGLCHLLLIAIVVAFNVYGDFLDPDVLDRLVIWSPVIWVGSFILIFIFSNMVTWLRTMKAKARQHSRTAVAETLFQKAAQAAEKRLRETSSVLEQSIRPAETQRKKAGNALQWFQSQVSTIT